MRKPNFFIVGAPKSGTSSMYDYLRQHPDIFMSKTKEPHFFGGHRYSYPETSWADYLLNFKDAKSEKLIGEASTGYLYLDKTCKFIHQYDSDAKILIMLRNPVNMVYAWHSELLWQCVEDEKDFRTALALEPERKMGRAMPKTKKVDPLDYRIMYRSCGCYYKHVKKYLEQFGKEQVHIIIFENFIQNTELVYKNCIKFLNVDISFIPDLKISNPNKYPRWWFVRRWIKTSDSFLKKIIMHSVRQKNRRLLNRLTYIEMPRPSMPEYLNIELTEYFQEDVDALEQLTEIDLSVWKKPRAR